MAHQAVAGQRAPLRLALAATLAAIAAWLVFSAPPAVLEGDQARYATLGLNLLDHGVFSSAAYAPDGKPPPSLAWGGPLIGAEVALAAALDPRTKEGLACIAATAPGCDMTLPALRLLHLVEILVFLACLWSIGHAILVSEALAWLTAALGLGFREVFEFSNLVMTEPLYLMAYGLFAAALVQAIMARKPLPWWILTGLLLGLVVLIKPSAAVLVPIGAVAIVVATRLQASTRSAALLSGLCLAVAASAVVALWVVRGEMLFDTASLTDPTYLEASLSHRLAYNRMGWAEWLAGWIYFLPDFGDHAAAALFGAARLEGLGFGPAGHYHYGYYVLHPQAHALTAPALATSYLVKTYMLGEPVKFLAVSALLTWRGFFVGRYLGLVGLVALAAALWCMPEEQRRPLGVLAVLALALAAANGALSIGLARYNLALIPVYAVSIAWVVERIVSLARSSPGQTREPHALG